MAAWYTLGLMNTAVYKHSIYEHSCHDHNY